MAFPVNWLSQGAMPFGFVMFAGMIFGFLRRKAGHRLAAARYPALAEKLGLTYKPSRYREGVGQIVGRYEGYSVVVDPDDQRRIRVVFQTEPQVDLRNYDNAASRSLGLEPYFSADKRFASFFKTSFVGEKAYEALEALKKPSELTEPLRAIHQLKQLNVTPSGVSAVFDFGNPPYIPAEVVEGVLPRLIRIARVFE